MGIVFAISNLAYLTLLGIIMGVQPVIGYNFGAPEYPRVRKTELTAIAAATVFVMLALPR